VTDAPGDNTEQYILRVALENALTGEAKVVEASIDRVTHASEKATAASEGMDRQNKKTKRSLTEEALAAEAAARGTKQFGDEAAKAAIKSKMLERQNKKTEKSFLGFIKFGFSFEKLFKAYKIYVIGDALQFVATAINGLGSAGIAAIGGLAPLSGMLAAYPGLLAAGAQGMAAFKIGMSGMGPALQTILNPTSTIDQVYKSMHNISANGRMVLITIAKIHKSWLGVRQSTQDALLKDIAPTIRDLAQTYLPTLQKELGATATELNKVAHRTANWLNDPRVAKSMDGLMGSNAKVVGNLGGAAFGGMRMLVNLLIAAEPLTQHISHDMASMTNNLANTMRDHRSGIREWLLGSYDLWKKTWAVVKDFGIGMFNIFKASKPLSKAMGEDLGTVAKNFRDWTESDEGRKKMHDFFEKQIPVVRELGKWIIDIGKQWFRLTDNTKGFLKTSGMLRTHLLPDLVTVANSMAGKFLPSLVQIVDAWARSPFATSALSNAISMFATSLDFILRTIEKMPAPMQTLLGNMLTLSLFFKMQPEFIKGIAQAPFKMIGDKIKEHLTDKFAEMTTSMKVARGAAGLGGLILLMSNFGDQSTTAGKAVNTAAHVAGAAMLGFAVGGPWGAAIAGAVDLTYELAAKWLNVKHNINEAGLKAKDYAGTLDSITAKITQQTKMQVAQDLQKSGVFNTAEKYGISDKLVLNSAMGNYAAQHKLARQMRNVGARGGQALIDMQDMTGAVGLTRGSLRSSVEAQRQVMDALGTSKKYAGDLSTQMGGAGDAGQRLVDELTGGNKKMQHMVTGAGDLNALLGNTSGTRRQNHMLITMKTNINNMVRAAQGYVNLIGGGVLGIGSAGLPNQSTLPSYSYFTGGTHPGGRALVGELGPEAAIDRYGKISMLGMNGPEITRLGAGTAIIPASATADPYGGATGKAPGWAVSALQRAYDGAVGTGTHDTAYRPAGGHTGPMVHNDVRVTMPIQTVGSDFDAESAVRRAWMKIQQETEERAL